MKKKTKQFPTYDEMHILLHQIYIARNISLDESVIHDCLKTIDKWFSSKEKFH